MKNYKEVTAGVYKSTNTVPRKVDAARVREIIREKKETQTPAPDRKTAKPVSVALS